MYYRPNAIKGEDLKIHKMLISMATPENHEVMDPWKSFNIIYIIRTKAEGARFWHFATTMYAMNHHDTNAILHP